MDVEHRHTLERCLEGVEIPVLDFVIWQESESLSICPEANRVFFPVKIQLVHFPTQTVICQWQGTKLLVELCFKTSVFEC